MRPAKHFGKRGAVDSFNQVCTVRVELIGTDPPIWREVEVPTSVTLKVLHDIVQISMGWLDYHLYQFTIGGHTYGLLADEEFDTSPEKDAAKVRLRDVLKSGTKRIDYLYDFGDAWAHRLTVTRVRAGAPKVSYPRYVGGEWANPPEDCGGISGFYDTLDALADPERADHAEVAEYLDGWDPREIDEFPLRVALGRIASHRNAAHAHLARKSGRLESGAA